MALVVPDVGEIILLDFIRAGLNVGASFLLKLYQNNYTPVQGSVNADFTEATFSGYSSASFTDWGAAATISNKASMVTAAAKTFSHNGGGTSNTVYGYYYVKISGSVVLWAERFPSPVSMAGIGDVINITPKLTLNSEN